MSSVQSLREFIIERLTAAAEEIFTEFEKSFVQFEEELSRHRLPDSSWKPQIQPHTTDFSQQYVWEEEDQLFCDREEPEHPQEESGHLQLKEEPEQLGRKQETKTKEKNHQEPEPNEDQLFGMNSSEANSQDKNEILTENSGSRRNEELKLNKRCPQTRDHGVRVEGPKLKRHKQIHTELSQHYVWKEEDQQLFYQEWNSILDKEEPEAPQQEQETPQMKEEQEELCISQDEEQPVLKQETDNFMVTATYKGRNQSQPEPDRVQIIPQNSPNIENQDQQHGGNEDSKKQKPKRLQSSDPSYDADRQSRPKKLNPGEKWYTWAISGKCISQSGHVTQPMRIQKGEKLYLCQTCGRHFNQNAHLIRHMRTHTGEKPYPCEICGKSFSQSSNLTIHLRTHTGEKPFSCQTCGKHFTNRRNLKLHDKAHRWEGLIL